jgi:transcriptional regulator with XRE-family HTH domain
VAVTAEQPATADRDLENTGTARIRAARTDLGRHLVAWRESAGLSQDALGRRLSCSPATVAAIECGHYDAVRRFWQRVDRELDAGGVLVKAFDELADLLGERREPQHPPHRVCGDAAPHGPRCA